MLNWILIALIAWAIVGLGVVYGYGVFKMLHIAFTYNLDPVKIPNMAVDVLEKEEGKPVVLIDNPVITLRYTDCGNPGGKIEKAFNNIWNCIAWPATLLFIRSLLQRVEHEVAQQ